MIASQNMQSGFFAGAGAATSISLGWVPDRVEVVDLTSGTVDYIDFPSIKTLAFTAGGAGSLVSGLSILPGHIVVGAVTGATAQIKAVALASGSFAAGTAAGFLILDAGTISGTFNGSEAVFIKGGLNAGVGGQNDAVTTSAAIVRGVVISGTAGPVLDASDTAYVGSFAMSSQGFTVAAAACVAGHLYAWTASRS